MAISAPAPVSSKKKKSVTENIIDELRRLKPEQRAEIAAKLMPPKEPSLFEVPRNAAGGITHTLVFDEALERYNEIANSWRGKENRYYFSNIGQCFRKKWFEAKGIMADDGLPPRDIKSKYRFDPGKSEVGNAMEARFQYILEQVYGAGSILKNVRMSEEIKLPKDDGSVESIFVAGKSDQLVVGDNLDILNFYEVKAPEHWPDRKKSFVNRYGKIVPLHIAGIEEPMRSEGIANINQLLQLAAGVHMLRKKGLSPQETTLFYVDRSNMRNHIEIKLSHEDAEFLHDFGIWWIMEHHTNLRSDIPPEPQYFMGWECRLCPFAQRCKSVGGQRRVHDNMIGINAQLATANGRDDTPGYDPPVDGMKTSPIPV